MSETDAEEESLIRFTLKMPHLKQVKIIMKSLKTRERVCNVFQAAFTGSTCPVFMRICSIIFF